VWHVRIGRAGPASRHSSEQYRAGLRRSNALPVELMEAMARAAIGSAQQRQFKIGGAGLRARRRSACR
jgi:hypothetical protein